MKFNETTILRFRDLNIESGGTIKEHLQIMNKYGEVWWGWWMKQYETSPRKFFKKLQVTLKEQESLTAYLYNTGLSELYSVEISEIKQAPPNIKIPSPDPERSPAYYHRGQFPAWFKIRRLKKIDFEEIGLVYSSFPSRPDLVDRYSQLSDKRIKSLEELREHDVTLWGVRAPS